MRCKACDKRMTDFESTRKYLDNQYVDMCTSCFKKSDYPGEVIERADLAYQEHDDYGLCKEDYTDD